MREHATAFHRDAGMSPHPQALADGHIGAGPHVVEIASRDPSLDVDVVRPGLMNPGRVGLQGDIDIPNRRQLFEIDGAGLGNVFGFGAGGSDTDRQQVTNETRLVGCQRRVV